MKPHAMSAKNPLQSAPAFAYTGGATAKSVAGFGSAAGESKKPT
jgi:hypothetical protein